ncbi:MAG: Flp family type IVb pilin [Firmicutes bacterium]|nr:Flp family type IVb pilin [Bacillota bacterium]
MLKFMKRLLKDERGITTVEMIIAAGILAAIAIGAYTTLRPHVINSANTIGTKLNTAVGSNNPAW